MSNTQYDSRFPFGKPARATNMNDIPQTPKAEGADAPKVEEKPKSKRSIGGKLMALASLSILAYLGYDWYQENQDTAPKDVEPTPALKEEAARCPEFKPTPINASYEERAGHAYVLGNLDADPTFSTTLDSVVVREIGIGLSSGLEKYKAIGLAAENIQEGIQYDAKNPPRGIGYGLTQLRSNFPTPMAIQTRDLNRVQNAAAFRVQAVVSNLDTYSAQESQVMLDTFGGLLAHPDLAREAAVIASKNPELAAQKQKIVFEQTAQGIRNGLQPHDAACQAVRVAFDNAKTPLAFYTYAQTAKFMSGKTKTDMLNILGAKTEEVDVEKESWIVRNAGWLMFLGALSAGYFLGRSKEK